MNMNTKLITTTLYPGITAYGAQVSNILEDGKQDGDDAVEEGDAGDPQHKGVLGLTALLDVVVTLEFT